MSFIINAEEEYKLLDSGNEEKLEKFGEFVFRRPDPQALWNRLKDEDIWGDINAFYRTSDKGGKWETKDVPESFNATIGGVTFELSLSHFKHLGIFPEQIPNWNWVRETISQADRPVKVLNLFGYTGGATVACLQGGAEVVHVDSSKTALTQANRNAELSGVADKKVRWIPDDARKFVEREIRRGEKYDAIIMDPPAFGHGAKKELWKIEDDLLPLLELTQKLLSDKPLFFILNGYASGYSSVAYKQSLDWLTEKYGGSIEHGELLIQETDTDRFLPGGITARWSR